MRRSAISAILHDRRSSPGNFFRKKGTRALFQINGTGLWLLYKVRTEFRMMRVSPEMRYGESSGGFCRTGSAAPAAVEKMARRFSGSVSFFGLLGVHQFYSETAKRGVVYLLMSTPADSDHSGDCHRVFVVIDLWRISHGTFGAATAFTTGPRNFFPWVLCTALGVFLLLHSCHGTIESGAFSRVFRRRGGLNQAARRRAIRRASPRTFRTPIPRAPEGHRLRSECDGTLRLFGSPGRRFRRGLPRGVERKTRRLSGGVRMAHFRERRRGRQNFQPVLPSDPRCKDAVPDFVRNR